MIEAAEKFSASFQQAFGPVQAAVTARYAEPPFQDEDDDWAPPGDGDLDDSLDDDDPEPGNVWAPETLLTVEVGKRAVLEAEKAANGVFLLFEDGGVASVAAARALHMLGSAIGALHEIPRDSQEWPSLYVASASIHWRGFNRSARGEIRRAGRPHFERVSRWRRSRYVRWADEELKKKTSELPDGTIAVVG